MTNDLAVPTMDDPFPLTLAAGTPTTFVGANGSGKTRLAVWIENRLRAKAHRIAAHRSLALDPEVERVSEERARYGLQTGDRHGRQLGDIFGIRRSNRWQGKEAIQLLNDYRFLIQTLYADRERVASDTYERAKTASITPGEDGAVLHGFDRLSEIFARLLPHRKLIATGDLAVETPDGTTYSAAEMSDGERGVFYMLGQALMAEPEAVLIVDEPELHMHRAILPRLWDEIEAARPDCALVYITHDLDFAASRTGRKLALRAYHGNDRWDLADVPEDSGFSEDLTTLILGSRRPILFVESEAGKLDEAVYRACYPDWTVVARGSCQDVIHAVATLNRNAGLHRNRAAGIVDLDGRDEAGQAKLREMDVYCLPVSEVENLFLLPEVVRVMLEMGHHVGSDLDKKAEKVSMAVIAHLSDTNRVEQMVVEHVRRRVDGALKRVMLPKADTLEELNAAFLSGTGALDLSALANARRVEIEWTAAEGDVPGLLRICDDRELLALAAGEVSGMKTKGFRAWLLRSLEAGAGTPLRAAVLAVLPNLLSDARASA